MSYSNTVNNGMTISTEGTRADSQVEQDAAIDALELLTGNRLQHATTGGTSTAYTLAAPGFVLVPGARVSFNLHTVNGASPTLNVNSTGAIALQILSQGGYIALHTGWLGTAQVLTAVYTGVRWQIINVLPLAAADIPAALNSPIGIVGSTTGTSAGVWFGGNGSTGAAINAPSGASIDLQLNGTRVVQVIGGELRWPSTNTTGILSTAERAIAPHGGSTTNLLYNVPLGGSHLFTRGGTLNVSITDRILCGTYQPNVTTGGLTFATSTADGADNVEIVVAHSTAGIAPGSSQTRGAAVWIAGNEHATRPGRLNLLAGATGSIDAYDKLAVRRLTIDSPGVTIESTATSGVVSVGTSFTTVRAVTGTQVQLTALVTGKGSIVMDWDGTTLTKHSGPASLVVAGSAGAGETAFRISGGNLQAIVDTGTRNVSCPLAILH